MFGIATHEALTLALGTGDAFDVGTVVPFLFAAFFLALILRSWLRPATVIADDDAVRCPTCGYDVRAAGDRCPECGDLVPRARRVRLDPIKLRDEWPSAPIDVREPSGAESLVVIWHPPHAMAANLLVEQLRARGVKAIVQSKARAMRVGEYTPQGDDHAVAVWSGDVDRVEVILERFAR